jgi:hypothetical protein
MSHCKPLRKQKLIEIPSEEVWYFDIGGHRHPEEVRRYRVSKEPICGQLTKVEKPRPITERPKIAIVTKLNEQGELPMSVKKKEKKRGGPFPLTELETCCMSINDTLRKLQALAYDMTKDGTMTDDDWRAMIESVNIIKCDLDGTLRIMEQ